MLDQLKKKKMLEKLSPSQRFTDKDTPEQSTQAKKDYLKNIKSQGADLETMKMLMGNKQAPSMADKPVYEELKKVPLVKQMEMMRDNTDKYNQSAKESQKVETEEERKRRMLENMFGSKGNV